MGSSSTALAHETVNETYSLILDAQGNVSALGTSWGLIENVEGQYERACEEVFSTLPTYFAKLGEGYLVSTERGLSFTPEGCSEELLIEFQGRVESFVFKEGAPILVFVDGPLNQSGHLYSVDETKNVDEIPLPDGLTFPRGRWVGEDLVITGNIEGRSRVFKREIDRWLEVVPEFQRSVSAFSVVGASLDQVVVSGVDEELRYFVASIDIDSLVATIELTEGQVTEWIMFGESVFATFNRSALKRRDSEGFSAVLSDENVGCLVSTDDALFVCTRGADGSAAYRTLDGESWHSLVAEDEVIQRVCEASGEEICSQYVPTVIPPDDEKDEPSSCSQANIAAFIPLLLCAWLRRSSSISELMRSKFDHGHRVQ